VELKNAVAVCLISLFSATLVVLIARSFDSQAASRLEPQLASIVEELQALRKQGGIAASPGAVSSPETAADGLVVYYFHSNVRCPTCRSIETQAHDTIQTHFAPQLGRGEVVWKILNYEQPANKSLATRFEIQVPVVVLARMKGGQVQDWKRLDDVWALVDDKAAYTKYVREEVDRMLAPAKEPVATAVDGPPILPVPEASSPAGPKEPPATGRFDAPPIPVPEGKASGPKETPALPIPE